MECINCNITFDLAFPLKHFQRLPVGPLENADVSSAAPGLRGLGSVSEILSC